MSSSLGTGFRLENGLVRPSFDPGLVGDFPREREVLLQSGWLPSLSLARPREEMVDRVIELSIVDALLVAERVRLCDMDPNPPPSPRDEVEPEPNRLREMASRPSIGRRVCADVGVVGHDLASLRGW